MEQFRKNDIKTGETDEMIKQHWSLLPPDLQQALLLAGFKKEKKEKVLTCFQPTKPKNHRLSIRVSKEELASISIAARAEGKSVSVYIRSKCLPNFQSVGL